MTIPIITAAPSGVRIRIHVQPGAATTEVVGRHGDALRVRLATPPVDGKANDALIHLLAECLGVPRRAIEILSGAASRRKVVMVTDVSVANAMRLLLGNEFAD